MKNLRKSMGFALLSILMIAILLMGVREKDILLIVLSSLAGLMDIINTFTYFKKYKEEKND